MLSYETYGRGPHKVMVLHDWFSDHTSYEALRPFLNGDQFTYVFPNFRGYGQSKAVAGECTLMEAAEDVKVLAQRLKWHAFSLVGHSMSGQISQYLAASHPEQITRLVLIAPVPAAGSPVPEEVMGFLADAALSNDESAMQSVGFMTGGRHDEAFVQEKVARWRRCSRPEARVAYLEMFTQTDIAHQVRGCACPTLVIAGFHDAPAYQAEVLEQTVLKDLIQARMVVCPDAGHYPMEESPQWLSHEIESFLSEG